MPSTWTKNLGLEKPATGEQAGVWGNTVNSGYDFLDAATDGNVVVQLSASSYTLLTNPGAPSLARNKVIVFTGALTQEGSIRIEPDSAQKLFFVLNHTTGGFALNFTQGTGNTFKLLNGRSAIIYTTGIGGAAAVWGVLADQQVNSLLVQANLIVQGQVQWGAPAIFNQPSTFQQLATFSAGAAITAPLTINLGADAPYDLLYRSPAGTVARLPLGPAGYTLQSSVGGLSWVLVQAFIGMPVVSAAAYGAFFGSPSGTLVQDGWFNYYPGTGLGIGIGASRALSLGGGGGIAPSILMDNAGPTPSGRTIAITTNGYIRWIFGSAGDGEAENPPYSASIAGSSFSLSSYNNNNTVAFTNFASYRSGRSTFGIWGDGYGAQVAVVNQVPAQDAFLVRGVAAQAGVLQRWQNSAGATVASIDVAGNLFLAVNPFLMMNNQQRVSIGTPQVAGSPLGTLHIGRDGGSGANCIAFEKSSTLQALTAGTANIVRMFFYGSGFSIQYFAGGQTWYASLSLTAGGAASWTLSTAPQF